MNNQNDRYLKHLATFKIALEKSIKKNKENKIISTGAELYLNDGRTPFFQLQGLARIDTKLGKGKQKKIAEIWLNEFKEIEDALGQYDYWVVMLENNKRWKFPKPFEDYINNKINYNLGVLEERLLRFRWLKKVNNQMLYSDLAFQDLKKSLKKLNYVGPEKERKKLLTLFRDEIIEIHDKVKSKEIDLNNLEYGIHEFRRKVRWIGIYSSCLLGKVRISGPDKNAQLQQFVTKENMNFKFNQLPFDKQQKAPVYYLQGGFYAMSDMIRIIGDIKDPGLATEEMMNIANLLGFSSSVVKKNLGKEFYPHTKVVKDASEIISNYLFRQNVLVHIAEYFDKQIK